MNLFDDRSTKTFAVGFIVGVLSMGTSMAFAQDWQSETGDTPSADTPEGASDASSVMLPRLMRPRSTAAFWQRSDLNASRDGVKPPTSMQRF